jgi:hypothetical protein
MERDFCKAKTVVSEMWLEGFQAAAFQNIDIHCACIS